MKRNFFDVMKKFILSLLLLLSLSAHADDGQPIQSVGVVSWFDQQNGYGFITPCDSNERVFVHFSAIVSQDQRLSLYQGLSVRFAAVVHEGSLHALWVLPSENF